MNAAKFFFTLALVGATLTGCNGAKDAKRAPEDAQAPRMSEQPEPASAVPDEQLKAKKKEKHETVRVFYGTDRNLTGSPHPKTFFGTRRASLSLGFCDVSIPENHEPGKLESPKIWKLEFRENPDKHVVLKSVEPASGSDFLLQLRQTIEESVEVEETPNGLVKVGGEAFIFIHGFNNSFEDAARRTAQIAYDLKFKGAPLMYSWPSQERGSIWAYKEDGRTAQWCEENVTLFIEAIARESGARKIHLIAHSMGNRVLSRALKNISQKLALTQEAKPLFNEVILTAPDIDAQVFKESIAPHIVQTAERFTIYSSSEDLALKASRVVNSYWHQRLGEGGSYLTVFPEYKKINVVDASEIDTNLFALGHSYHADSNTVLSDVRLVFQGIPAGERNLRSLLENLAWKFQSNRSLLGRAIRGTFR
ncbi:MAG: alpha/beta hydrolase [Planctomycetaceae bacterium]|nr:alpha/beta hydrolase [Planctomycetaceae bacterium]